MRHAFRTVYTLGYIATGAMLAVISRSNLSLAGVAASGANDSIQLSPLVLTGFCVMMCVIWFLAVIAAALASTTYWSDPAHVSLRVPLLVCGTSAMMILAFIVALDVTNSYLMALLILNIGLFFILLPYCR